MTIKGVARRSAAARAGICPGGRLISVNGRDINDVLDYQFAVYDRVLRLVVENGGSEKSYLIRKGEGGDIGLEFGSYLMDKPRSCVNKCVFCFIDQLPAGMRDTLYFKDDDARLSFLHGNYISLTNLTDREAERIIEFKISPVNISVHTTNPALRCLMLGNSRAGDSLRHIKRFADASIRMNFQIVVCPRMNDGAELRASLGGLTALYPAAQSISVVPVGLTKHREGLAEISPYNAELAAETIGICDGFASECLDRYGSRVVFCADELYLLAGIPVPDAESYEEFPQLENGVGMLALFRDEFINALEVSEPPAGELKYSIATGLAAYETIKTLINELISRYPQISCAVYPVTNNFFGSGVTVSGLITGRDIIRALSGKELGQTLTIPENMLISGGDLFLDDMTVSDLSDALGIKIIPVKIDGAELVRTLVRSNT